MRPEGGRRGHRYSLRLSQNHEQEPDIGQLTTRTNNNDDDNQHQQADPSVPTSSGSGHNGMQAVGRPRRAITSSRTGSVNSRMTAMTEDPCLMNLDDSNEGTPYVNIQKDKGNNKRPVVQEEEEEMNTMEEGLQQHLKYIQDHIDDITIAYFREHGPTYQNIQSYNHFINKTLPRLFTALGYFQVEDHANVNEDARVKRKRVHTVEILDVGFRNTNSPIKKESGGSGDVYILYPHEARIRGLNYTRDLVAKFRHTVSEVDSLGVQSTLSDNTHWMKVGEIPIMVKSEFCSLHGLTTAQLVEKHEDPDDPGGYFIIRGKEKVLISQERPANNKMFIFKGMSNSDFQLQAEIRSVIAEDAEQASALWIRIPGRTKQSYGGSERDVNTSAAINDNDLNFYHLIEGRSKKFIIPKRDAIEGKHIKSMKHLLRHQSPGLVVTHMDLNKPFPLLVLYKALGFENDRAVLETIGIPKDLELAFQEKLISTLDDEILITVKTQQDAIAFIGKLIKVHHSEQFDDREAGVRHEFTEDEYYGRGLEFLQDSVLPHVGAAGGSEEMIDRMKGYHLGYMVNRLIQASLGRNPCDDRDHLENKRYDLPGPLLGSLLKRLLNRLVEELRQKLARRVQNGQLHDFSTLVGNSGLTNDVMYAFSSGTWGDRRFATTVRVGVSQPLNRLTGLATLGFLRRIQSPVNRLNRMILPRRVHNTAYGYTCPVDTPEGETVGLLKSLAIMAQASVDFNPSTILAFFDDRAEFHPLTEENRHRLVTETKVLINAMLIGTIAVGKSQVVLEDLKKRRALWDESKYEQHAISSRKLRRHRHTETNNDEDGGPTDVVENGQPELFISNQTSIVHDTWNREIKIRVDGGRLYRPLFVIKNNMLQIKQHHVAKLLDETIQFSWKNLVQKRIVEYLDAGEEENALIAMFPANLKKRRSPIYQNGNAYAERQILNYTHCEIDPSGILGVSASLVPYANHSQLPRITFQTNMSKQAIGVYSTNYECRFDTESHILYGGQKPLVTAKAPAYFTKNDENPPGQNAIVAIYCYTGYNQEDSLIMNSSAIQRGFLRSTAYKTREDSAVVNKAYGVQEEAFEKPIYRQTGRKRGSTDNLDEDGFPSQGCEMKDGDILIGKTQSRSNEPGEIQSQYQKEDVSELFKIPCSDGEVGAGARANQENRRNRKETLEMSRTFVDKVAIFNNQDLPFTKEGIVPDIIINPHAIPSRMTIGHLLETLDAKLVAHTKVIANRTAFRNCTEFNGVTGKELVSVIRQYLREYGFEGNGYEVLYNGYTGRKLNTICFLGPCFYQRLKHMTEDKLRFRARGSVNILTRQPNFGIARDGGLRFGEMERDSAIAHGGAQFLIERLFHVSDYSQITICGSCGQMVPKFGDPRPGMIGNSYLKCISCGTNKQEARRLDIPHGTKLLLQELGSLGILVNLICSDDQEEKLQRKRQQICMRQTSSNSNTSPLREAFDYDILEERQPIHWLIEAELDAKAPECLNTGVPRYLKDVIEIFTKRLPVRP